MTNAIPNIAKFRPMLSASLPCTKGKDRVPTADEVIADLKKLDWSDGMYASPKLDGIRAVKHPQLGLVSRSLKRIPNLHIQKTLSNPHFDYLDGELVLGDLDNLANYNDTQSAVMSEAGQPAFKYYTFDHVEKPNIAFRDRWAKTLVLSSIGGPNSVVADLEQHLCKDVDELLEYEARQLIAGHEGVIIRYPYGAYKNGRSTFLEQGMIKLKRFVDAEAVITGFVELYRNENEPTIDSLGYQKRSAHLAGKTPAGILGALEVRGIGDIEGIDFEVGSGFDEATRTMVWNQRIVFIGKIVKLKFQPHGVKEKPRAPIFLGFRHPNDL